MVTGFSARSDARWNVSELLFRSAIPNVYPRPPAISGPVGVMAIFRYRIGRLGIQAEARYPFLEMLSAWNSIISGVTPETATLQSAEEVIKSKTTRLPITGVRNSIRNTPVGIPPCDITL